MKNRIHIVKYIVSVATLLGFVPLGQASQRRPAPKSRIPVRRPVPVRKEQGYRLTTVPVAKKTAPKSVTPPRAATKVASRPLRNRPSAESAAATQFASPQELAAQQRLLALAARNKSAVKRPASTSPLASRSTSPVTPRNATEEQQQMLQALRASRQDPDQLAIAASLETQRAEEARRQAEAVKSRQAQQSPSWGSQILGAAQSARQMAQDLGQSVWARLSDLFSSQPAQKTTKATSTTTRSKTATPPAPATAAPKTSVRRFGSRPASAPAARKLAVKPATKLGSKSSHAQLARIGIGQMAVARKAQARAVLPRLQPLPANVTCGRPQAQAGSYCGYHALWNGYARYQQLRGAITQEAYQNGIAHFRENHLKTMKDIIIARRRAEIAAHGDRLAQQPDLTGQNIEGVEAQILAGNYLHIPENSISIISELRQFNIKTASEHLSDFIHTIRTQDNVAPHIFVLGTMTNKNGHWISIVVFKVNGQIRYYADDSSGGGATYSIHSLALRLIQLIERDDLDTLRLGLLDRELGTAAHVLRGEGVNGTLDQRLNRSLDYIAHLIVQARRVLYGRNPQDSATFNRDYRPTIQGLLQEIVVRDQAADNRYAQRARQLAQGIAIQLH